MFFGNQLTRARLGLLSHLKFARRILLLGEGDGRFLRALVDQNPHSNIVVVDRSRRMLARARRRVPNAANVRFIQSDAQQFLSDSNAPSAFDAIVTLFVLDCLDAQEVEMLVRQAGERLTPTGAWLWADFVVPRSGLSRPVARVMLRFLYWFFRTTTDTSATTLIDPTPHFEALGLNTLARTSTLCGMVQSRYMCRGA